MKKILLSTLVASLLISGVNAKETAEKNATVKEVNKIAVSNAKEVAEDNKIKFTQEAIDSLKEAQEALIALVKKDAKLAKSKLESALGKLEVILAAKDAPKLLPIESMVTVNEFVGTSKDIDVILEKVKKLIDAHKVQVARVLMMPLKSQIDITVVSLPLVSYPDALKLAANYVHSNELTKAQRVLELALSTFARVTNVVPLPLIKATDLIVASAAIGKEDKERAILYLDGAKESLEMAYKLGYISRSTTTYKQLQEMIDELKKEINGPNSVEKLFDNLKEKLKEFKSKIIQEENKNKGGQS